MPGNRYINMMPAESMEALSPAYRDKKMISDQGRYSSPYQPFDRRQKYTARTVLFITIFGAASTVFSGTESVNVDSGGAIANNQSYTPSISSEGRYVAFSSPASNLVEEDINGKFDIFLHDRKTNTTHRVSTDPEGAGGNKNSLHPSISANGCYIAFDSIASNFVAEDTNGRYDIFVYDCETKLSERVSISSTGEQANNSSETPSLSAEGRYIAFTSNADNLVVDDTNGKTDVFVFDRETRVAERASSSSTGVGGNGISQSPSISENGRFVAFKSSARNLSPNDANGKTDIFVFNRETRAIERISVDSTGIEGNNDSGKPSISANGRFVAFESEASNLVPNDTNKEADIFVHDREVGTTQRISINIAGEESNGFSASPRISSNGRYVAFKSSASNLIPTDTNGLFDIFVHDRDTGKIQRVSVDSSGIEANNSSETPSISADGQYVAYKSYANNLVPKDTNKKSDIFVNGPNKPPEIISPATAIIAENSTAVLTLEASDLDGDLIRFSVTGGVDGALFTVNATHQLSFLAAPDEKNPGDSNTDNIYEVEVTANDGHDGTSIQAIKVAVVNAEDFSRSTPELINEKFGDASSNPSGGGGTMGLLSLLYLWRRCVNSA